MEYYQVLHDKKTLNLSFSCVLFSDEIKEQNQIFKVNHDSTFQNSMADISGMLVVIRRSDETVIETVSTNDELNILKASGCGLKILVELITLAQL